MPDESPDELCARLVHRDGSAALVRTEVWVEFNAELAAAGGEARTGTVLDASRTVDEVEHDVRCWIDSHVGSPGAVRTDATER